jgi:hypothetical protein
MMQWHPANCDVWLMCSSVSPIIHFVYLFLSVTGVVSSVVIPHSLLVFKLDLALVLVTYS